MSITDTFRVTVNALNDNPTVATPLTDVTVSEDAVNSVISLTSVFADVDIATNSDTLTLSITGNTNTALFAGGVLGVTLADVPAGGSFVDDKLTLDFAPNQNGTADITITATDGGGLLITDTFRVTVNAINDNPTVATPITDVTVNEDAVNSVISLTSIFADVDIATNSDILTMTITGNTNAGLFTAVSLRISPLMRSSTMS